MLYIYNYVNAYINKEKTRINYLSIHIKKYYIQILKYDRF